MNSIQVNGELETAINQLVDLIYRSMDDEEGIFKLADQIFGFLRVIEQSRSGFEEDEYYSIVFESLIEHFYQALEFQEQRVSVANTRTSAEKLFNLLPVPLMLLSHQGEVLVKNDRANQLIVSNQQFLPALIESIDGPNCLELNAEKNEWKSLELQKNQTLKFHVTPLRSNAPQRRRGSCLISFFDDQKNSINSNTLTELFDLTESENQVLIHLCAGLTRKEIAERLSCGAETIKTHMKNIFQKLSVSSQESGLEKVYKSPAILNRPEEGRIAEYGNTDPNARIVELEDGRKLSYAVYGPENGVPVIFCHNFMGSRLQVHPDLGILDRHGIREIIPDRPGFGLSDYYKGRKLEHWPKDVAALLKQEGFDTCRVIADNDSTCYGMALAYYLPNTVEKLTLTSPLPMLTRARDLLRYRNGPAFGLLAVGRSSPTLINAILHSLFKKPTEDLLYESTYHKLCPADQDLFNDPFFFDFLVRSLNASRQQKPRSWASDNYIIANKWGFEPSDVKTDIDIWYGDNNPWATIDFVEEFINQIPNTNINFIPDGSHTLGFRHWETILAELIK